MTVVYEPLVCPLDTPVRKGHHQAALGVWSTNAPTMLLWASLSALHKITRADPEANLIKRWAKLIAAEILGPVKEFQWQMWFAANRSTDAESFTIPAEFLSAWAVIPAVIRKTWAEAADVRTTAEGLPFDKAELDQAIEGAFRLVRGIPDTLAAQLRNLMRDTLAENRTQFDFARTIRKTWEEFAGRRANLIAVTEWNRAASTATYLGYVRQGVQTKVWLTAGDNRVCPVCESNAVDGEIPLGDFFESGDLYPPAHPGCRCDISGV